MTPATLRSAKPANAFSQCRPFPFRDAAAVNRDRNPEFFSLDRPFAGRRATSAVLPDSSQGSVAPNRSLRICIASVTVSRCRGEQSCSSRAIRDSVAPRAPRITVCPRAVTHSEIRRRSCGQAQRRISPLLTSPDTIREAVGSEAARFSATADRLVDGHCSTMTRARNCGTDNPPRCRRISGRINQITGNTASSNAAAHARSDGELLVIGNDCIWTMIDRLGRMSTT